MCFGSHTYVTVVTIRCPGLCRGSVDDRPPPLLPARSVMDVVEPSEPNSGAAALGRRGPVVTALDDTARKALLRRGFALEYVTLGGT